MLNSKNILLKLKIDDNELPLTSVDQCTIRIDKSSFCIYAETVSSYGFRRHFAVTDFRKQRGKMHIILEELDYNPEISIEEKIIDIRDIKKEK